MSYQENSNIESNILASELHSNQSSQMESKENSNENLISTNPQNQNIGSSINSNSNKPRSNTIASLNYYPEAIQGTPSANSLLENQNTLTNELKSIHNRSNSLGSFPSNRISNLSSIDSYGYESSNNTGILLPSIKSGGNFQFNSSSLPNQSNQFNPLGINGNDFTGPPLLSGKNLSSENNWNTNFLIPTIQKSQVTDLTDSTNNKSPSNSLGSSHDISSFNRSNQDELSESKTNPEKNNMFSSLENAGSSVNSTNFQSSIKKIESLPNEFIKENSNKFNPSKDVKTSNTNSNEEVFGNGSNNYLNNNNHDTTNKSIYSNQSSPAPSKPKDDKMVSKNQSILINANLPEYSYKATVPAPLAPLQKKKETSKKINKTISSKSKGPTFPKTSDLKSPAFPSSGSQQLNTFGYYSKMNSARHPEIPSIGQASLIHNFNSRNNSSKSVEIPTDQEISHIISSRSSIISTLESIWNKKFFSRYAKPSSLALPKECTSSKTHWDILLQESQWLALDFRQELRWKKAVSKNLGLACVNAAPRHISYRNSLEVKYQKSREESKAIASKISSIISKKLHYVKSKLIEYVLDPSIRGTLSSDKDLNPSNPKLSDFQATEGANKSSLFFKNQFIFNYENGNLKHLERPTPSLEDIQNIINSVLVLAKHLESLNNKSQADSIENSNHRNCQIELLSFQKEIKEKISMINQNGFGCFLHGKCFVGKTVTAINLMHSWLYFSLPRKDETSGHVFGSKAENSSLSLEKLNSIYQIYCQKVLVFASIKSCMTWRVEIEKNFKDLPFQIWEPNYYEFTSPTSSILFIPLEYSFHFLDSIYLLLKNNMPLKAKGIIIDIRGLQEISRLDFNLNKVKLKEKSEMAWLKYLSFSFDPSVTNRLLINNSCNVPDVPSLLSYLIPQAPPFIWDKLFKEYLVKLNIISQSNMCTKQFNSTEIYKNVLYYLLFSLQANLILSDELKARITAKISTKIEYVEMNDIKGISQKLKYNNIISFLIKNSKYFSGEDPELLSFAIVLLQRVCFHSSLISSNISEVLIKPLLPKSESSYDPTKTLEDNSKAKQARGKYSKSKKSNEEAKSIEGGDINDKKKTANKRKKKSKDSEEENSEIRPDSASSTPTNNHNATSITSSNPSNDIPYPRKRFHSKKSLNYDYHETMKLMQEDERDFIKATINNFFANERKTFLTWSSGSLDSKFINRNTSALNFIHENDFLLGGCKFSKLKYLLANEFNGLRVVVLVETETEQNVIHHYLKINGIQAMGVYQNTILEASKSQKLDNEVNFDEKVHQFGWLDAFKIINDFNNSQSACILVATKSILKIRYLVPWSADAIIVLSHIGSENLNGLSDYEQIQQCMQLRLLKAGPSGDPLTIVNIVIKNSIEEMIAHKNRNLFMLQGVKMTDFYAPRNSYEEAFSSVIIQDPTKIKISSFLSNFPSFLFFQSLLNQRSSNHVKSNKSNGYSDSSSPFTISPNEFLKVINNKPGIGKGLVLLGPNGNTSFSKNLDNISSMEIIRARAGIENVLNLFKNSEDMFDEKNKPALTLQNNQKEWIFSLKHRIRVNDVRFKSHQVMVMDEIYQKILELPDKMQNVSEALKIFLPKEVSVYTDSSSMVSNLNTEKNSNLTALTNDKDHSVKISSEKALNSTAGSSGSFISLSNGDQSVKKETLLPQDLIIQAKANSILPSDTQFINLIKKLKSFMILPTVEAFSSKNYFGFHEESDPDLNLSYSSTTKLSNRSSNAKMEMKLINTIFQQWEEVLYEDHLVNSDMNYTFNERRNGSGFNNYEYSALKWSGLDLYTEEAEILKYFIPDYESFLEPNQLSVSINGNATQAPNHTESLSKDRETSQWPRSFFIQRMNASRMVRKGIPLESRNNLYINPLVTICKNKQSLSKDFLNSKYDGISLIIQFMNDKYAESIKSQKKSSSTVNSNFDSDMGYPMLPDLPFPEFPGDSLLFDFSAQPQKRKTKSKKRQGTGGMDSSINKKAKKNSGDRISANEY